MEPRCKKEIGDVGVRDEEHQNWQFVAASSNQLRVLCERRLEDLNLVVLMIDGIHLGGQVLGIWSSC